MSFVSKEIRRFGYIVVNDVQVLAAQYHFECDSASDLPSQTQFQNDKNVFLFMGSTAHTLTDNKQYEMKSDGIWADITPNSGGYTLPPASISSLGGIIVGSGLSIDADGVLSTSGGASMPYTNHNGGIRGKNLGISYTAEQKASIAAGTFDDIYVGDYWEISGIKYHIVDIDYYMGFGSPQTTEHHVIVFPDDVISSQGYAPDSYYYGDSNLHTTYLPTVAADLATKFGNYLINQSVILHQTGGTTLRVRTKCILPSMQQLQGYSIRIPNNLIEFQSPQFSHFRYSPILKQASQRYWLRDTDGQGVYGFVSGTEGLVNTRDLQMGDQYYLRPYFILAGVSQ